MDSSKMQQLAKSEPQQSAASEDSLPMPGFRFHPTDEELVAYYLPRQLRRKRLPVAVITQLDIYKYDPWDLPKLATVGEKEWFFFCPRDRKYRNSLRPNRVTDSGFWKATGTDRPIYSTEGAKCIGLKKSLVFYRGRGAKGIKTDWMMHEFRLPASTTAITSIDAAAASTQNVDNAMNDIQLQQDGWAVCRIFKKTKLSQKHKQQIGTGTASHESACATTTVDSQSAQDDQSQAAVHDQHYSQYNNIMSVDPRCCKDQDSDSGDDPEASDVEMVSDFNSEGTSPFDSIKDLPPAEMTPFEHLILCDESGRRSNLVTSAAAAVVPNDTKPVLNSSLPDQQEHRPFYNQTASKAHGLQAPITSDQLNLISSHQSGPVDAEPGAGIITTDHSATTFKAVSTTTEVSRLAAGTSTNSCFLGRDRFFSSDHHNKSSSFATDLSPSTRNTLELVQSILSPASVDHHHHHSYYGNQSLHRAAPDGSTSNNSEPIIMSHESWQLKTAQFSQESGGGGGGYINVQDQSGTGEHSSMKSIINSGEQSGDHHHHHGGPSTSSSSMQPAEQLSVRVPQHVREFLDNLPPWDFSPLFISPPTLALLNNSMNHSQDHLFQDQD